MEQNCNVALLNEIYQNSKMGIDAIDTVSKKVDDRQLKSDLTTQSEQYSQFASQARQELAQRGTAPIDNGPLSKATLWSSIQFNTLIDSTPSHIAEMMINGSTMGIVQMTKQVREHSDIDDPVRNMASHLIRQEQDNIERMKQYL